MASPGHAGVHPGPPGYTQARWAGPLLATGERANGRTGEGDFDRFLMVLVVFARFPMILVVFLWFSHVSGRSGGRANGRANPPRAQASGCAQVRSRECSGIRGSPPCTLCYAIVPPGRESAFRAEFWPDCYRESTEVGPPAGRRPAGPEVLRILF